MTDKPVRVRFAPSPTGSLHIGGARTALFNWLFARHHNGKFVLRIEDTDQKRTVEGAIEEIQNGLRWLGLQWDEGPDIGGDYGPYIQSQRLEQYQKWAYWLVEQGNAYRCYATPEELEHARAAAQQSGDGKLAGYERLHRFISDAERQKLHEARGGQYVIRLAMPLEGETVVQDAIRGEIHFPNTELSDIVLLKSDGFPTYHLAMAVDDHLMDISHVMRSDEWLPSLPMHEQIYAAFGWEAPVFVHLPVVLNPNGKGKLSKRTESFMDGKFRVLVQVREYIEAGYQPEAVVNWLTNVGWSFGEDREIFSVAETIERFTLDRINPAGSALPYSKLENINGHYIRAMRLEDFTAALRPVLQAAYGDIDETKLQTIAPHLQVRVNPINQAVDMVRFLFVDIETPSPQDLIQKKMDAASTITALQRSYDILNSLADFRAETLEPQLRALVEELGLQPGQLFNTLRWATTAQQVSPPLFESLEALGKEVTMKRLQAAINILQ